MLNEFEFCKYKYLIKRKLYRWVILEKQFNSHLAIFVIIWIIIIDLTRYWDLHTYKHENVSKFLLSC